MKKILVLHANDTLRSRIGIMLQQEGFTPVWAVDGETGLDKIRALKPQLLLIDLPLAGISAVELWQQMRDSDVQIPVTFSAKTVRKWIRSLLLEAGVDDYIVKPFSVRELLARIRAVVRRTASNRARTIRFGDVEIDPEVRIIDCGNTVSVTPCDYNRLLSLFTMPTRHLHAML